MTDYGRGPAPQPWHPDDPLFGDLGGHTGQQGQPQHGWGRYGDEAAPGGWQQQYAPGHQQYEHQQYGHQQNWDGGAQPGQPYGTGQYAGWQQPDAMPYDSGHTDPHGYQYADPYGPGGYAEPQQYAQQQHPQQEPGSEYAPHPQHGEAAAEQTAEWRAFEEFGDEESHEPETHPFFTDADGDHDEDDEDEEPQRGRRGGRKDKERRGGGKRRSGTACLLLLVLLGGVVGGGGYFGYRYWQSHFAAPPDYAGQGGGDVQVDIPKGASLVRIGNILKQNDVVESVEAFTKAAAANPKGATIQGGIYTLHKEMSAAAAVAMMLDPSAQNTLIVAEGLRATRIYAKLDAKLGLKPGTTAAAAKTADLGLPAYAGGNPEGFLFPTRYSVGKGGKPEDILKQMVQQAQAEYTRDGLEAAAAKVGKTPYQVIVIASLIQAEAKEPQDFGRVSRVIYNRLAQNMALGFDSTINYAKGRSTLNTTQSDTHFPSPYNTYLHKGLPPGPIDNPGHEAIEAALNPTAGDWLYFVTVKPGDTRFTANYAEHQRNVQDFNRYQQEHGG